MSSQPFLLHKLIECANPRIQRGRPETALWEVLRREIVGSLPPAQISPAYCRVMARVEAATVVGLGALRVSLILDMAWHGSDTLRRVMPHVPRWTMPGVEILSGPYFQYASAKLLLMAAETQDLNFSNAFQLLVDAWLGLRPGERWPYGRLTWVEAFRAARSRLMEGGTVDPFFGPGEVLPIPECLAKRDSALDLSPLWTVGEVLAEANEMVNCISESNYLGPMRRGKTVAYSIRRPERATLVIIHSGGHGWFLHDLAGPRNEPASEETEMAVRRSVGG